MDKLSVMNAFCRIVERESFARAVGDCGFLPPCRVLRQSVKGADPMFFKRETPAGADAAPTESGGTVTGVTARFRRGAKG